MSEDDNRARGPTPRCATCGLELEGGRCPKGHAQRDPFEEKEERERRENPWDIVPT